MCCDFTCKSDGSYRMRKEEKSDDNPRMKKKEKNCDNLRIKKREDLYIKG